MVLGISISISAQEFLASGKEPIAGKDYKLLDNTPSESSQIKLYCWLGSESCYLFETALREWATSQDITIQYMSLIKRPNWRRLAKAHYVAQQMNIADELSALVNQTLHDEKQLLESDESVFELVESLGSSSSRFANLFYAAETNLAVNELQNQAAANHVRGVPTIVINDIWLVDASMHKTSRGILNTTASLLGVEAP